MKIVGNQLQLTPESSDSEFRFRAMTIVLTNLQQASSQRSL